MDIKLATLNELMHEIRNRSVSMICYVRMDEPDDIPKRNMMFHGHWYECMGLCEAMKQIIYEDLENASGPLYDEQGNVLSDEDDEYGEEDYYDGFDDDV